MYSQSFLVQFVFFAVSLSSQLPESGWKAANFQKSCGSWGDFDESCSSCSLDRSAELPSTYECQCQTGGIQRLFLSHTTLGQVVGNWDGRLCCGEGDYSCGETSKTPPMYF
ncbi:uncharacterized protein GLRG_11273 [Colletotrichum graminicola M1.001]|uniref:Uncharacterized protein n=1 Tax=Colletotrichum graminicola (strain M1.001 / M2 / FGSC 10212) TaxID=645133 RepID=E3QZ41_COLGM|nr:uncharacterized protein GLRG_11273 [Colletotrichum graminicola M1.001]EFQ36129.1 hypothetical protein GLRG_11273 [Colletotrichum graminicola M1.001]